jgi:hypothetical protein
MLLSVGCAHAPSTAQSANNRASAYALAMTTFACWYGPVWEDALGEPAEQRKTSTDERCREVATTVWNDTDRTRLERLRAVESVAVEDTLLKVKALAKAEMNETERRSLVALFTAVAAVQKENMYARRGADRVKIDLENEDRTPEKLTTDDKTAADALDTHAAIATLLAVRGTFANDAHALGLLAAMDRVNAARGLPKHMKLYATRGIFALVFGLMAPRMPSDPSAPLWPGQWLDYLTRAAAAAGHPLVDGTRSARDRNQLAWGSVLEGFADKLRPDLDRVSVCLQSVVRGTVTRLDAEYIADRNAVAASASAGALR